MNTLKQGELNTIGQIEANTLVLGECLESMKYIADSSVDAIITDLPYG
jgi:DNA modification methylase